MRTVALAALVAGCASDLGATSTVVGILPDRPTIQGRDGGPSARVWDHDVWTFGDTVLNVDDADGTTWHHNSWSWTDDRDASDNLDGWSEPTDAVGAPAYLVAPTADEEAFNVAHRGDPCAEDPCGARWAAWPGAPVWDAARDRALIFYGLIRAEPGPLNFHGVGTGVAVWDAFDAPVVRPELSPGTEHPTLLFGEDDLGWSTSAVIEGDDLYAFDCDSDADGLEPPCRLARVPVADVLDRAAWRFWDGAAWSTEQGDAERLFGGAPQVTVSRNAHLGAWTAVYAPPFSDAVVLRTAPELTGPWSKPGELFVADKPDGWPYDAVPHPELEEDGGRVLYVTFSRSNHVGWFGAEFPLVRVELP